MSENERAVVVAAPGALEATGPGWTLQVQEVRRRMQAVTQLYREVMVRGVDYDTIPGTQKPTLLQPGAQLLDMVAGYSPTFETLANSVVDWDRGLFAYEVRCRLVSKATGEVVAEGLGSCNSREDRYRWREAKPTCPKCGKETIRRSSADRGGGWYCWSKLGGCGAQFKPGDPSITNQPAGRVENDEPYTLVNTLLKMAQKRAHVAATLNATGASRIFTQDVEDMVPDVESTDVPDPPQTTSQPAHLPQDVMTEWANLWQEAVALKVPEISSSLARAKGLELIPVLKPTDSLEVATARTGKLRAAIKRAKEGGEF